VLVRYFDDNTRARQSMQKIIAPGRNYSIPREVADSAAEGAIEPARSRRRARGPRRRDCRAHAPGCVAFGNDDHASWRRSQRAQTCAPLAPCRAATSLSARLPSMRPCSERGIGHDRDARSRHHGISSNSGPAAAEIIEDLVGRRRSPRPRDRTHSCMSSVLKLLTPVMAGLAVLLQPGGNRPIVPRAARSPPMQEIEVDPVGLQAFEAAFAGVRSRPSAMRW